MSEGVTHTSSDGPSPPRRRFGGKVGNPEAVHGRQSRSPSPAGSERPARAPTPEPAPPARPKTPEPAAAPPRGRPLLPARRRSPESSPEPAAREPAEPRAPTREARAPPARRETPEPVETSSRGRPLVARGRWSPEPSPEPSPASKARGLSGARPYVARGLSGSSKACEVRDVGVDGAGNLATGAWRRYDSQTDAVQANEHLTPTMLSDLLAKKKLSGRYEARRVGEPSPERPAARVPVRSSHGRAPCELRLHGARAWTRHESVAAAAAAHGDLSEPYLSAMLRGEKGHARLEARRLGEPSPERGRLPDPRPYGEKACEIRRPGEALWRLYDTQTAAVADSPGLSMSVLSLMLSSGHRPSGGAAGYEARRPGDEAAAPGAVVRETSEATAESADDAPVELFRSKPSGSLGPRDSNGEFRCPAGCPRTFSHAPAAVHHGKSCKFGGPRPPGAPTHPERRPPAAPGAVVRDTSEATSESADGAPAWTAAEDAELAAKVAEFGYLDGRTKKRTLDVGNWETVAKHMSTARTAKQLRYRWHAHVDPAVKKGPWTIPEVRTVIVEHGLRGNRWVEISLKVPGRSDVKIEGAWRGFWRQKLEAFLASRGLGAAEFAAALAEPGPRREDLLDRAAEACLVRRKYGSGTAAAPPPSLARSSVLGAPRARRFATPPPAAAAAEATPAAGRKRGRDDGDGGGGGDDAMVDSGVSPEEDDAEPVEAWAARALGADDGGRAGRGRAALRAVAGARTFAAARDGAKVEALAEALGDALLPAASEVLTQLAAKAGTAALVALLIDACAADPRAASVDGWRPLHAAAAHDRAENARVLLQRGAKLEDDELVDGLDAVDVAHGYRSKRCLALFLDLSGGGDVPSDDERVAALSRPTHDLLPAFPRDAAAVVADAFVFRRAARDAHDALTAGDAAAQFPFNARVVAAVAALREALEAAVDGVDDQGAVRFDRGALRDVAAAAARCRDRFRPAPPRPRRPAPWPAAAAPPFIYDVEGYAVVDHARRDADGLAEPRPRLAIATYVVDDAESPLHGQLAVVATEDLAAGAEAPYGGVVGPAATLATACDLGPLEQVGYWRWLIYREEDETVLLPFVDELRNPACFINDAQGPKRRGGESPNVAFLERGAATVVVAARPIAAGDVVSVDYGDAYWDFERVLSRVEERLTRFAELLDAHRDWAADAASLEERTVPRDQLLALRLRFGETRRSKRPRPPPRELIYEELEAEGPQHLPRKHPPRRPSPPPPRRPSPPPARAVDPRPNRAPPLYDDSAETRRGCDDCKARLVQWLRGKGVDAATVARADAEVTVRATRRRIGSRSAKKHDYYYFHDDGRRVRSRPEVAEHFFGMILGP